MHELTGARGMRFSLISHFILSFLSLGRDLEIGLCEKTFCVL